MSVVFCNCSLSFGMKVVSSEFQQSSDGIPLTLAATVEVVYS